MARKSTPAPTEKPKPLNAEVVRTVCQLKADERLDLHRRIDKESANLTTASQALTKKRVEADEAARDAVGELDAYRAYKGHVPAKEYEAELKRLTKAKDAAEAHKKTTFDSTAAEHQRIAKPLRDLQTQAEELTRQWKFHAKRAEEAGLDVSEFWTPEKGVPPEEAAAEE